MAVDDAVSAPVWLPALYQTELLAAQAEFVRHGRSTPVDVPELVAALPGLFAEITVSATNPTGPDPHVFSAED